MCCEVSSLCYKVKCMVKIAYKLGKKIISRGFKVLVHERFKVLVHERFKVLVHEGLSYHLQTDFNKLKMYTINLK